jgi:anti-sigma-K factor RskA
MSCDLVRETGAAVALGAAEALEAEAAEAHARRCSACAQELRALREVAAELALALPQQDPPAACRARLLAAARADLEPEQVWATRAEPARPSGWRELLRSWSPGLALGGLAAAVAALIWGASLQAQLDASRRQLAETNTQLADTSGQLERLRGNYWAVASVLAAPSVRTADLSATDAAPTCRAKIWVDPTSGRGMMMARDLPPIGPTQVYQVWLVNQQGRVSGGFLRPNDEGIYYVVLQAPGKLTDYQQLGVTVEPLGGSPSPTGQRVIAGTI